MSSGCVWDNVGLLAIHKKGWQVFFLPCHPFWGIIEMFLLILLVVVNSSLHVFLYCFSAECSPGASVDFGAFGKLLCLRDLQVMVEWQQKLFHTWEVGHSLLVFQSHYFHNLSVFEVHLNWCALAIASCFAYSICANCTCSVGVSLHHVVCLYGDGCEEQQ